jgi:hypothetical protein
MDVKLIIGRPQKGKNGLQMKANHIILAEAADRFPPPSLASIKISFLLVGTNT